MDEILEVSSKLYYELNPNSKIEVPIEFQETIGTAYFKYLDSGLVISFYQYCKSVIV